MPKNKFQDLVFTTLMVIFMVYPMTAYNMALEQGFTQVTLSRAAQGMWTEAFFAFFAQRYFAGPIAKCLTFKILQPGKDHPIFITLAMGGFTVSLMAPVMTLLVTCLHHGLTLNSPILWIEKWVLNFPFALCIQIFYVGPMVRALFRTIFNEKSSNTVSLSA